MPKPTSKSEPLNYELEFAMHDSIHCLTPGLFRSVKNGDRKKTKLDVSYPFSDGGHIEFSGPEPLGDDDLRVLQGLIAMAGPKGSRLPEFPQTSDGMTIRQMMDLKWGATSQDGMVVKGSYRNLAKEIGYADVENTKPIQDSVERMWKVSVIVEKDGQRMGFRLLSEYGSNDIKGQLYVALNPQLTAAIVGDVRHTRISMDEVRAIKLSGTRLVHQRLCGWIDQGKTKKISIDTLCSYINPDHVKLDAKGGDGAMRQRRSRAKPVLEEMRGLGWGVVEIAKGQFEITRPKGNG